MAGHRLALRSASAGKVDSSRLRSGEGAATSTADCANTEDI